MASPGIDVVGEGDGVVAPLASVGCTDAPELGERSVALNVRPTLADSIDVVSTAIAVYSAQRLGIAWGRKGAVAVHYVILNERIC